MKNILISFFALFCVCSSLTAQNITPFKDGDRVGFLGNSITDGGHYHSYIWLYYMTRFPDMQLTLFNIGIGGDRAIDMVNRFDGDVLSKNLTVLITTFGMNDSGYFEYNGEQPEAFADQKVKESYDAYKQLESRFKSLENMRMVLMGSSPYDETAVIEGNNAFKNKNKAMLRIVDFQRESAKNNGWEFLDLNTPITALNKQFQQKDPTFTICGNDRIHPDNDGHMIMAYMFLKEQGFAGKEVADIKIDASKISVMSSSNCEINNLRKTSTRISFNYLAKSLPYPMDTIARGWGSKKSQAESMKIVPFVDEMNKETLTVKGLTGNYKLIIDEENIGIWSAKELAEGINLATLTNTPQYQQALKIMMLNEERWEIERRFREYAWVEFNFFLPKGITNLNSREAIQILDKYKDSNGWLNGRRDLYSKAMFPEIRKAWQDEINLLTSTIYEINKPRERKITLVKIK
ncbi:SGNH/GDSL hydrolase family protein [Dysgonomonas sp. Marseille-P4677]|uniref:SGNH/GDSL hydrolase family protein n=1 Tax=Dysgonomonas sp. Marseille-P4677 TaxID=2364790 RepID=UPI001912AEE0|nr:SGNH/GDSL hydrolase family protein [Dysgonomonas sp. Marseille-P4677]MBK5720011.1 SGNH/GDSL hydrolase family protein [Dysgonomonas sp. Marseille-P4677]